MIGPAGTNWKLMQGFSQNVLCWTWDVRWRDRSHIVRLMTWGEMVFDKYFGEDNEDLVTPNVFKRKMDNILREAKEFHELGFKTQEVTPA